MTAHSSLRSFQSRLIRGLYLSRGLFWASLLCAAFLYAAAVLIMATLAFQSRELESRV